MKTLLRKQLNKEEINLFIFILIFMMLIFLLGMLAKEIARDKFIEHFKIIHLSIKVVVTSLFLLSIGAFVRGSWKISIKREVLKNLTFDGLSKAYYSSAAGKKIRKSFVIELIIAILQVDERYHKGLDWTLKLNEQRITHQLVERKINYIESLPTSEILKLSDSFLEGFEKYALEKFANFFADFKDDELREFDPYKSINHPDKGRLSKIKVLELLNEEKRIEIEKRFKKNC